VTSRGRECASQAEDVGPDRRWISHAGVSTLEATDRPCGQGSLLTSIGQLSIASVDIVNVSDITATDGASAGAEDLSSPVEALVSQTEADVYRVRLSFAGPDPRLAMRADIPLGTAAEKIVTKLRRMLIITALAAIPGAVSAQTKWSVGPMLWVDTDFNGTEVGPGINIGVSSGPERGSAFTMDLGFARTDFPVASDDLHRNHASISIGGRLMTRAGGGGGAVGVTLGIGALVWDDLNETDPGFRSSANAEELLVPGILARFPLTEACGVEVFLRDQISGWYNSIIDPDEFALAHRFILGVGIHAR
jgi:hypothetical protein